jgi:hypothetical protein
MAQTKYALNACVGKQPLDLVTAKRIAKSGRRRSDVALDFYRCKTCGSWHIGTNPKNAQRGKSPRRHMEFAE